MSIFDFRKTYFVVYVIRKETDSKSLGVGNGLVKTRYINDIQSIRNAEEGIKKETGADSITLLSWKRVRKRRRQQEAE